MSSESFWYLATPYSKYPNGMDAAFFLACANTATLIKAGVPVFSPIAHTHMVAAVGGIDPADHAIWLPADKPLMEAASGIIVLCAHGWRDSFGMQKEIEAFREAGKPVIYMVPGIVPQELLYAPE